MRRHTALTYRDYEALPDDGARYEIHEGELSVTPAPSPYHQMVSRNLFRVLDDHVRIHRLGEVLYSPIDVILGDTPEETTIVQPDIVYLDRARLGAISRRGIEGPPSLVVEVMSPFTATLDLVTKPRLYARHRVPVFWRVDPDRPAIEAFVLGAEGYGPAIGVAAAESVDLPPFVGLALRLSSLWP